MEENGIYGEADVLWEFSWRCVEAFSITGVIGMADDADKFMWMTGNAKVWVCFHVGIWIIRMICLARCSVWVGDICEFLMEST